MLTINSRTCVFVFHLCTKAKIYNLLQESEDPKHTTSTIHTGWLHTWTKFSLESKIMRYGNILDIGWSFEPFQMASKYR